jgi:hypothetical protein
MAAFAVLSGRSAAFSAAAVASLADPSRIPVRSPASCHVPAVVE